MLKPSKCSKLSVRGEKNSFGLPPVTSCPGATDTCKEVCYVHKFVKIYPGVKPTLEGNLEECERIIRESGPEGLTDALVQMVRGEVGRAGCFRIHWSGDFYSAEYAQAWRDTIAMMPTVQFWTYTRSFHLVPLFEPVQGNLRLYLSLDQDNWQKGLETASLWPHALLSSMGMEETWEKTKGLGSTRWFNCPAEAGGKLHGVRGACQICGVCVFSRSPNMVNFPLHR